MAPARQYWGLDFCFAAQVLRWASGQRNTCVALVSGTVVSKRFVDLEGLLAGPTVATLLED